MQAITHNKEAEMNPTWGEVGNSATHCLLALCTSPTSHKEVKDGLCLWTWKEPSVCSWAGQYPRAGYSCNEQEQ
ncbi:hypothetical protein LOK49_LG15G02287 [Camellia lanceoleosa]|uniref:Uncharacterized protein n=1 Tax=Camellia lanceoleosa TaxID=1840588 RepID=A0ACC0F4I4_9ERIC|nr:hypothetical protein LOK49_LG15G02287 [Camellia lanceoleosa]